MVQLFGLQTAQASFQITETWNDVTREYRNHTEAHLLTNLKTHLS